jgi:hypothetical protein
LNNARIGEESSTQRGQRRKALEFDAMSKSYLLMIQAR